MKDSYKKDKVLDAIDRIDSEDKYDKLKLIIIAVMIWVVIIIGMYVFRSSPSQYKRIYYLQKLPNNQYVDIKTSSDAFGDSEQYYLFLIDGELQTVNSYDIHLIRRGIRAKYIPSENLIVLPLTNTK